MIVETLFLHGKNIRPNGSSDSLWALEVEVKDAPLWWQEKGLSFTATGENIFVREYV